VKIPDGLKVTGVVLGDHAKNLAWRIRQAAFICKMPEGKTAEVLKN
jgi:mRNA interferase MazF